MAGAGRLRQAPHARGARPDRGDTGFGYPQVAQFQRARILAAMFDVAGERGAANVSVADVVERSGVSRRTFYEAFADREDCFLAAFEDALGFAERRVVPAFEAGGRWRERVRAGLVAFLSFLDEEPVIARLLVCESLTGGSRTLERRNEMLALVAVAIDEGREESASGGSLPPLTAEGLVGGVLALLHARIAHQDHDASNAGDGLLGLANQLVSMIVLPYLGAAAARRELECPVESHSGDQHSEVRLLEDPFKEAGMRLTYRTVRVLLAVSEHPGASNRLIGETAGMSDQGQISKLLGRLQRLGLVSNVGLGPGKGAPNAWTLTAKGRQMTQGIRAYTKSAG
jgi:AcrR family transcriptional regulator